MHADSASPHATSRSGVEEGEGKMATPVPPPFDDAAKQMARSIAAAAGKPKTRDEGLKAIHAVTHRSLFSTERLAWEHFGTTKQRFYEWKQIATTHHRQGVSSSPIPPPAAPPADEAASAAAAVAARERKTELQRERRQGEDSIIRAVVESLVAKIERAGAAADRKAWRARCTWRCPGGCRIDASDCARAAWRLRCMPSRAEVELQMSSELHTPTWQGIEYRSPSGYRYGARKLQQQVIEAVAAAQAFDMRDPVRRSMRRSDSISSRRGMANATRCGSGSLPTSTEGATSSSSASTLATASWRQRHLTIALVAVTPMRWARMLVLVAPVRAAATAVAFRCPCISRWPPSVSLE
jgi:hypothetical protein